MYVEMCCVYYHKGLPVMWWLCCMFRGPYMCENMWRNICQMMPCGWCRKLEMQGLQTVLLLDIYTIKVMFSSKWQMLWDAFTFTHLVLTTEWKLLPISFLNCTTALLLHHELQILHCFLRNTCHDRKTVQFFQCKHCPLFKLLILMCSIPCALRK